MEKKHFLSIQGLSACGKTKTIEIILEYFPDHSFHSTGAIARKIAADNNMEIGVYNKYARENGIPFDKVLDDSLREINQSDGKWIIDSRLAYFFVPSSFKVYLKVDPHVAAQRRLDQLMEEDPKGNKDLTFEEVFDKLAKRDSNDIITYLKLYKTNCSDEKYFDLVVDTTHRTIHQVASLIMLKYIEWLRKNGLERLPKKD